MQSVAFGDRTAAVPSEQGRIAVLLCADSKGEVNAVDIDRVGSVVSDSSPLAEVLVVDGLCDEPGRLRHVVEGRGFFRLIIACRDGKRSREAFLAAARRAGVPPAGIVAVDLARDAFGDSSVVTAEAAIRVRAALERAVATDLGVPFRERVMLNSAVISRRGLFRLGEEARRPVATWAEGRCRGQHCRACIERCPTGAVSFGRGRVRVEIGKCTGCGACVSTCPTGALSLGGLSVESLAAEVRLLLSEARRESLRYGVAIVCKDARTPVPLGRGWLPLEVPSLEMVTVGWLLQLYVTGAEVNLISCEIESCAARSEALTSFCVDLVQGATSEWDGEARGGGAAAGAILVGPRPLSEPEQSATVTFREPDATAGALRRLSVMSWADAGALPSGRMKPTGPENRRIESPLSPVGEVSIDALRCSACSRCVRACPTGALAVGDPGGPGIALTFDGMLCSACGACVAICPERAVSLRRVVDPSRLGSGRNVVAATATGRRLCQSCGHPIGAGLEIGPIAARLAESHPEIADRLTHETRCADCLLEV